MTNPVSLDSFTPFVSQRVISEPAVPENGRMVYIARLQSA